MNPPSASERVQKYSELRQQFNASLRDLRLHLRDVASKYQRSPAAHDAPKRPQDGQLAYAQQPARSSTPDVSDSTSASNDDEVLDPLQSVYNVVARMEMIESEMHGLEIDGNYPELDETRMPRSVVEPVLPPDDSDDGLELPDDLEEYFATIADINLLHETYEQELPAEYRDKLLELQRMQEQEVFSPVTEADLEQEYERRRADALAQLEALQARAQQLKALCEAAGHSTNPKDYERMAGSVTSGSDNHPDEKVGKWLDEVLPEKLEMDMVHQAHMDSDLVLMPDMSPIADPNVSTQPSVFQELEFSRPSSPDGRQPGLASIENPDAHPHVETTTHPTEVLVVPDIPQLDHRSSGTFPLAHGHELTNQKSEFTVNEMFNSHDATTKDLGTGERSRGYSSNQFRENPKFITEGPMFEDSEFKSGNSTFEELYLDRETLSDPTGDDHANNTRYVFVTPAEYHLEAAPGLGSNDQYGHLTGDQRMQQKALSEMLGNEPQSLHINDKVQAPD